MITCPRCKQEKPLSDYYNDKSMPSGYSYYCKQCSREKTNAYRAANREHYNFLNRRAYHMRKAISNRAAKLSTRECGT